MTPPETTTLLLNTAQGLIQTRGFNAFSYKDLAEAVGIRTASIHYHFPAKAELGVALMERYIADLNQALENIDRSGRTPQGKAKGLHQALHGHRSQRSHLPLRLPRRRPSDLAAGSPRSGHRLHRTQRKLGHQQDQSRHQGQRIQLLGQAL